MSGIIGKNSTRGSGAIGTSIIGADAVSGANIADDAIDSEHYVDGSIDNAHIADDAIDSEHYADGSIDNAHIADDAIDSEHYADGSIDNAHIADDAIDSEHYADGSIDNAHIADDAIDSEHYADGSIDTAHIATNQIDETLVKDAFVADFTEVTVATGDSLIFGDATDSGNTKRDTVQGVLDLAATASTAANVGLQTIWIPSLAMKPTASNPCADPATVETASGRPDMQVLDFDDGSDEHAQFNVAFPKSWNEGTITFQVYWCCTATDTDGVSWGLQGVSVPDNSTIDVAYGTAVVVDDVNQGAAEEMLVTAVSSAVTIAGAAVDTTTFFRIFRDVSDANDTAAEDARLLGVKLFFTTDAENDD